MSIYSVLLNYKSLLKTLDEVSKGNDEYVAKAKGVMMIIESLDVFFWLKLTYFIFGASERFSSNLQAKRYRNPGSHSKSKHFSSHCKSLHAESKFHAFYAITKSS